MAFYGYARFGMAGTGIVGDIGFDSQYADTFWRHGGIASPYSPLSGAVIDAANAQWQKLQDLIDLQAPSAARARDRMNQLRGDIGAYVAALEDAVNRKFDFQRDANNAYTFASEYNQINNLVRQFSTENWPTASDEIESAQADAVVATAKAQADAAAAAAAQAKADAAAAAAAAQQQQTKGAIQQAQDAITRANQAKQVAQSAADAMKQAQSLAAEKRAALATPLTIAAIAVPLAFVAYFALRSKKSAVAGYRRRRHR